MLEEIFAAILICLAFAVGALSYKHFENLVDTIKNKFEHALLTKAKNVALAPIAILGTFFAVTTKTPYFLIVLFSIIIFALLFGVFVIAEKDHELTKKYIVETNFTFLLFFTTVYAIIKCIS